MEKPIGKSLNAKDSTWGHDARFLSQYLKEVRILSGEPLKPKRKVDLSFSVWITVELAALLLKCEEWSAVCAANNLDPAEEEDLLVVSVFRFYRRYRDRCGSRRAAVPVASALIDVYRAKS
jgi:hypothetical protein